MKILQITFNLSSGGGERFVVDLSNELSHNEDVVLVQIQSNENPLNAHYLPDLSDKVRYINLGFQEGVSWSVMYKLYRLMKKEKPDVVNAHCTLLPIALAAIAYRKPRYFHTLHSLAERCLGLKWMKPLYKYLYLHRVHSITISKTCEESYEKLYSLNNAHVINNGRSPITVTSLKDAVKEEVKLKKIHPDDKVFIHVARFHPVKNHALLFSTFKQLISKGEHIILLVVGNGFEGHTEFNNELCKGIYLLGEKRNVGDYLSCADYFVISSLKEGLPISLIEAMSMGLIPVSTPAGGVCDVIRNHENGYLSKSHNPDDFCNTVKEAINNSYNITPEEIGKEYMSKYSMKRCAAEYEKLYSAGNRDVIALVGGNFLEFCVVPKQYGLCA